MLEEGLPTIAGNMIFVITFLHFAILFSEISPYHYSEKWGYTKVRPGANMFWWLYETTNASADNTGIKKPLIIWLQGGPGDSSCGFGNFEEIGPLDANLNPRDSTWLNRADLLFIDSPVGAGYSFVETTGSLVSSLEEMVDDLIKFTYLWLEEQKEYQARPVFVFGESHGGKVAVAYVWELHQHLRRGKLKMNLKGVGLGNSWISPPDFIVSWPEFLYYHSWLSLRSLEEVRSKALQCHSYTEISMWVNATECMQEMSTLISELTSGVSWYNILKHDKSDSFSKKLTKGDSNNKKLEDLMNNKIKKKLDVIPGNVTWGSQADQVYFALYDEMMRPVVTIVDDILEKTDLKLIIYNGQLDLICNTPGVQTWLHKLKWPKMDHFKRADRLHFDTKLSSGNNQELFVQRFERLWFFWILHAGHNVPADAGAASLKTLDALYTD